MSDDAKKFDYARAEITKGVERAAIDITWLIARETGKHIGNETNDVRRREELQLALESFLR
jgi:hypothetical protein